MAAQLLDRAISDVLTPMEAAKILHIGRTTIYKLLSDGKLRSFKIGTKILIPKSFLQDFIEKSAEISYHDNILQMFQDDPLETPVKLTVTYGLRRSEVCGLRWDAVDFEAGTIHVCHTAVMAKGKVKYSDSTKTATSNRILPLTANMRIYLQTVKARQEENKKLFGDAYVSSGYVCVHLNGAPIRPDDVRAC